MQLISLPQRRVHDTTSKPRAQVTPNETPSRGWERLVDRLARGVFATLAVEPRPWELEEELRI